MTFSKVICVVDDDVDVQDPAEVAWRVLANLDPKRDLAFVEGPIDQLDHGANQALWGGKVCIDGTRKWREEGYLREWPEPCRMRGDVVSRVEALCAELGLGAAAAGRQVSRPSASRTTIGSSTTLNGASAHPGRGASAAQLAVFRMVDAARAFLGRVRP